MTRAHRAHLAKMVFASAHLVLTAESGALPFQIMMLKLAETLKDQWRNKA